MELFQGYIILFCIIVLLGQLFYKTQVPISLILVIAGMFLSYLPWFPHIQLNPELVLNIFLPLLVYQISSFSSWPDIKKVYRPVALLSIGHVVFITFLVAFVIHAFLPELGWPLAFVLGAIISPPDDVAIVSIAEKIRIPRKIVTILEGEGLLNDATALTLFRFALAGVGVVVYEFSVFTAIAEFFAIVIGETLYGLALGYIIGTLRLRISNSIMHVIASILTPFLAYFPAEMLGGSGIIATVVTGFVIGHRFAPHFTPEYRLIGFAIWPALAFAMQSLLFLLVGLDLHTIMNNISTIPMNSLLVYSVGVIACVILGRFVWVYAVVYFLPRFLFASIRKKDPYPPWQFPLITSWAGMRGSISLAAALAIPVLPNLADGTNPRALIIFLVFIVIAATFVLQGLTLPWLLKVSGAKKLGETEEYNEHLTELSARLIMVKAVLRWLLEYRRQVDNPQLLNEIKIYISEYRMHKSKLLAHIKNHNGSLMHDELAEMQQEAFLLTQIIEIERMELLRLWHTQKITLAIRNKLVETLDHRSKRLST